MPHPPVLLVHGFASSFARNWQEPGWVDLLTESGREVIAVDLLGHGDAPKPHDPAAYADLESSVEAMLPPGRPVDAVGFSLGGALLLRVAARAPERFRRLVVAGVGANLFRGGDAEPYARALTGEDEGGTVGRAFSVFARAPGNDAEALAACLRRPTRPFTAGELAGVRVPVLVVLGDLDWAGPADPLLEALPDARLTSLRGADHFGTPKDVRFLDAALAFLDVE